MRILLSSLAVLSIGASASANLVRNGDFEANPYGLGGHVVPATITGWTQIPGAVVAGIGTTYLGAPSQEIDLSGYVDDTSGTGIYQDLATVAGRRYTLSLDVFTGGNVGYTGGVDVRLNDNALLATNLQGFDRTNYQFSFVATDATTRLFLTSNHGNVSHVDNVNVAAVPGPAAFATFGVSLVRMRRRKAHTKP